MSFSPISVIQGASLTSPFVGQSITTQGVVTALLRNGFTIQDPKGDGDNRTSDAVFVQSAAPPTRKRGHSTFLNIQHRVRQ